ncbi:MAG: ATP synthase F0 subunit B [Deltaproteobacteria bacterium]|jgi:F-type H+-transporting ATPase subunit b|nr:ATP synthase F0 subunit B [Deltaproteobacteria bacterium]
MSKIFTLCTLVLLLALLGFGPSVVRAQEAGPDHVAAEGAGHEAGEASEGAGHDARGYSASQWRDFGWRAANFVVFALALFFLLRKPAAAFLSGRREGIGRTLEYLETQSRNLEEQTRVMRRKLSELSQERSGILTQYEREGARERDRIIADAAAAAETIIQRAEAAVAAEIQAARRDLVREAGALAKNIAEKRLREQVTDEDRWRLALDFVDQVIKLPSRK